MTASSVMYVAMRSRSVLVALCTIAARAGAVLSDVPRTRSQSSSSTRLRITAAPVGALARPRAKLVSTVRDVRAHQERQPAKDEPVERAIFLGHACALETRQVSAASIRVRKKAAYRFGIKMPTPVATASSICVAPKADIKSGP